MLEENYYKLLQVDSEAETPVIRFAYRYLVARYHPDNEETGDRVMFAKISKAWRVLCDAETRSKYDESLRKGET
jgi:DnaJ-class molecular chaperone